MKTNPFPALILWAVSAFTCHVNDGQTKGFKSVHFNLQELAPGVWAAINNDSGGHAICNAGIVDLGDRTVVFDPFMNLDAAADLRKAAETLTRREVGIVVNSHYHNDHIRGNQVFLPALILGTTWTREKIAVSEPEELAWEVRNARGILEANRKQTETATGFQKEELPLWISYFEGMVENSHKVRTTLPNQTFTDSLWIHGSARSVKLFEYRNGHTASDLVLMIPKEGIVFAGDLLFNGRHAWIGDGDPDAWSAHLRGWMDQTVYSRFVPGHGQPGDKKAVAEMIDYIQTLGGLAASYQKDTPDSTIKATPVPERFRNWKLRRFYPMNLSFLRQRQGFGSETK